MKIFLDTNVFIRYFLKDNNELFESCFKLMEKIEEGRFRIYTSSIVFLELAYVLKNLYHFPQKEILDIFKAVLGIRGLVVIERTDLEKTVYFFESSKVKFADCLIASQIPPKATLVTFDTDFSKIPNLLHCVPQELL